MKKWRLFSICFLLLLGARATNLDGFTPKASSSQQSLEELLIQTIDTNAFKQHLKQLTSRPHVAGNPANEKVRDYMFDVMKDAGWKSELYHYDVYMSHQPGTSLVELVTPIRLPINQQEYILPEDSFSGHPNLWKGWNAYSGSGDVTAEIVYANYGRKEDFEKLESLGITVKGKIVLARYGGNFRGYKAKFAEAYGAVGLIIYTDPEDAGYMKGLTFPEGAFYSESTIQRGSLLTTDFTGDPLTPFEPALPQDSKTKVNRIDPEKAQLHTIPVTPIAYG